MTTSRIAVRLSRTAAVVRRWAVGPITPCLALILSIMFIPGLASAQSAGGGIAGTVKDASGSAITGAIVTLETSTSIGQNTAGQRTAITDQAGGFHFLAVERGSYKITIAAAGFAPWTAANVTVDSGDQPPLSA